MPFLAQMNYRNMSSNINLNPNVEEEPELDDETGEVEGNEELDKDMWGDEEVTESTCS